MTVRLLFVAVALVAACAHPRLQAPGPSVTVWSSSELNARKQEMHGAEVVVDAYLVHEPENYSLWDSEKAQSTGNTSSCITLVYPNHLAAAVRNSNRKLVRLRGTFVRDVTADGGLYLGLCNYTGLRVAEILR